MYIIKMSKSFEIEGEQFTVDFFDVNSLPKHSSCLILGKRHSGKTSDVVKIIQAVHQNDNGVIFTDNKTDEFYKNSLPLATVSTNLSVEQLELVANNPDISYIVIDCILNLYSYTDILRIIYNIENKTKITVQQFSYNLSKLIQDKIDYIIIHNDCFFTNHVRIHQYYMNFINSFDTFEQLMKMLTVNYDALIVDKQNNNKLCWFNSKTTKLSVNDTVSNTKIDTVIYSDFIDNTYNKPEDVTVNTNKAMCNIL